ncbi:MAG TPA: YceI family protein [Terracidiphilus sp.]|nr:YceI family protein [Terracidiphilus sp.]
MALPEPLSVVKIAWRGCRRSFAALGLAAILAPAALAQHRTFVVNPDASQVRMTLKTTHELVSGAFHVQSGSIEFDPGAPAMSGSIVVLAGSGNTGNGSRDKKMNKDILKVEQFPTVSFEPRSYTGVIAPSGDSTIQVTGIFTLLGVPHQIAVPMQVHLDGARVTAKAEFVVPYVQWGLKNPSFLIWKAENDVVIDLNLMGTITK